MFIGNLFFLGVPLLEDGGVLFALELAPDSVLVTAVAVVVSATEVSVRWEPMHL